MNDPGIPGWFMVVMLILALAQTGLLVLACVLIRNWAGTLNRKLHRIESNTRHVASVLAPEDEGASGKEP